MENLDFSPVEKVLLYRDFILHRVFINYPKDTFFTKITKEDYSALTADLFSNAYFSNPDLFWIILFFNEGVDLSIFGLETAIDANEFLNNKLDFVYKQKVGQEFYTTEQIEKVFDMFYNRPENDVEIILPYPKVVNDIKTLIFDLYKEIVNA
jgi:hypothetical protein